MHKNSSVYSIWLVALLLSLMFEFMLANNGTEDISKDISVKALAERGIIQFDITLLKPLSQMYSISIETVSNENDEFCKKLEHCIDYNDQSISNFKIPHNGEIKVYGREPCHFQFDCSYNISINTINTPSHMGSVIYHVEECINNFCACRYANELPIPKFNLTFNNVPTSRHLDVNWLMDENFRNVLPANVTVEHLEIKIHVFEKCADHKINTIYTSTEQLYDHNAFRHEGVYTKKNILPQAECLFVEVNALDHKNCVGPTVNSTLRINETDSKLVIYTTDDENTNRTTLQETSQYILIGALSILIVFGLVMLMLYGYVWWNKKKHILRYWHNIYNNPPHGSDGTQMVPMRENPLYLMRDSYSEDDIDIPASCIKEIGKEIGKGAFGRVYVARIADVPGKMSSRIVAIKKLKRQASPEQLEEFSSEIATMRRAGRHRNIVQLLGTCTVNECLVMIMEHIPCGDLLKYLRAVRAKHTASLRQELFGANASNNNRSSFNNNNLRNSSSSQILGPLSKYLDILHSHSTSSASETSSYISQPDTIPSSFQVGSGQCTSRPSCVETMYTNLTVPSNPELTPMIPMLEYIVDNNELHNFALQIARGMKHLEEKQITHRDLAARNVLIDENKTLKISDFGLARDGIYINSKNKKVPLRWLSIEAMKDNLYSCKSDVWSFGILLWEIGTLGGFPYPTVQNNELLNFLLSGNRLEKPEICSDMLHELMLCCWEANYEDRPNFSDICETLDPKRNKIYIDFSELSPTYVFPPTVVSSCKQ